MTGPSGSERATSTSSRPGSTTAPAPSTLPSSADLEAELHVGGAQACLAVRGDQDPGERLQRGAGGDRAGDDERVHREVLGVWLLIFIAGC